MESSLQAVRTNCRACFIDTTNCKYEICKMSTSLFGLFQQIIGERDKNENYPQFICKECHEKLENFDEFRTMCRKTTQALENLFGGKVVEDVQESFKSLKTEIGEMTINEAETASESEKDFDVFPMKEEAFETEATLIITEPEIIKLEFTNINNAPKPVYKCEICDRNYASSYSLNDHLKIHQQKRPFPCEKCERSFYKKSRLKNHVEEMHGERPFEIICRFGCGKIFRRHCTAANHYRIKHQWSTKSLKDPLLMNVSTKEEAVQQDNNEIGQNEDKPTCGICQKAYTTLQGLRNHMWIHKDKRKFQCSKCERSFNKKVRLKKHIEEIHSENPVRILCKMGCGKMFRRQETAANHYRVKHSTITKTPQDNSCVCEECGKRFNSSARLREHSYHHRPVEDWPYKCEQCAKAFAIKSSYKEHLLRHAGIKNFECQHCGARKTSLHELKIHVNRHTKNILYCCDVCGKNFTAQQNLKRHKQLVHEGIKRFECPYCDQTFGKAETLKFHKMTHTGERPNKCNLCQRAFIQPAALKAHMKTHYRSDLSTN